MVKAERTKTALYMRGTDSAKHIHVTEKGEPDIGIRPAHVERGLRPLPLRDGGGGADEARALHARDGFRPPPPRDGEGRARLRGVRVLRGERGRPEARREGARGA